MTKLDVASALGRVPYDFAYDFHRKVVSRTPLFNNAVFDSCRTCDAEPYKVLGMRGALPSQIRSCRQYGDFLQEVLRG